MISVFIISEGVNFKKKLLQISPCKEYTIWKKYCVPELTDDGNDLVFEQNILWL